MKSQDLSLFNNNLFDSGANKFIRILWYLVNAVFFDSWLFPVSSAKVILLRLFGAKVGSNVVIKPKVNIKYPWNVKIGDNVWLGESVWIDSLGHVKIGSNVCISQGVYLLTGNHDYRKKTFDLIVSDIIIEDSVWIGAKCVICPGVTVSKECVISVGQIITKVTKSGMIYTSEYKSVVKPR